MIKKRLEKMINYPIKPSLIIFLLIFIFTSTLFSQVGRVNYKILGITVVGNTTADPATIIANSGIKIGDEIEIPGDQTLNAIKRLWKLGLFTSDLKIEIEKKVNNRVFIVIKVNEFPRIEKFLFRGNDEIDDEDLGKAVTFVSGQILKPQTIFKTIREIKKLYVDKDLMNAKITTSIFEFVKADTTDEDEITVTWQNKNDSLNIEQTVYNFDSKSNRNIIHRIKDRLLLVYNIDEGEKVDVRKITFLNNTAFDSDDLKSEFSETAEPTWWKFWKSNTFNKEDYKKDSAYNVYTRQGLPPGPISNPSLDAIRAALSPVKSDYWYYLSDPKTKETIFSETLDEHNENRAKYLNM